MDIAQKKIRNQILASLTPADFALLQPHLERVVLPLRKFLEGRGRRIENVYFLESGLASIVVSSGSRHSLEVGMIGKEGMTGVALLMGASSSPGETFIQSAGVGWRIPSDALRQAIEESARLHTVMLRHGHVLMTQMAFTALANSCYTIQERLARWLLMAQDRAQDSVVALTHEFLSVMLGVRRPGVTAALGSLEKQGIIKSARGLVTVVNRAALEETANGAYGAAEAEYERLFGAS